MSLPRFRAFSSSPNSLKHPYASELDFGVGSPFIGKTLVFALTISKKLQFFFMNCKHHWKALIKLYNGSLFVFGILKLYQEAIFSMRSHFVTY